MVTVNHVICISGQIRIELDKKEIEIGGTSDVHTAFILTIWCV